MQAVQKFPLPLAGSPAGRCREAGSVPMIRVPSVQGRGLHCSPFALTCAPHSRHRLLRGVLYQLLDGQGAAPGPGCRGYDWGSSRLTSLGSADQRANKHPDEQNV